MQYQPKQIVKLLDAVYEMITQPGWLRAPRGLFDRKVELENAYQSMFEIDESQDDDTENETHQ